MRWADGAGVRWRILGNGSNLLVSDEGVRGLVIRLRRTLDRVEFAGREVTAGAGASFPSVVNQAAERGLSGLEFGAGIPGTIGGAVLMNAGWHEHEIGLVVESVEFLEPVGTTRRMTREECAFGYRDSVFRRRQGVILAARMQLEPDDAAAVRSRMDAFAESRKRNQPTQQPSCGSVFVQPEGDFAGRLIDEAGLKGLRVGGVEVSRLHANFFVNVGGATAADVLALVARAEREVHDRFGVRLEREFEWWGPEE